MRNATWLAVVLAVAGCRNPGGSTTSSNAQPPAPPRSGEAAPAPVSPPVPASPPLTVVEADVPSGAAAQRDAELAQVARPDLEAFTSTDAAFTRDGKGVLFVSNRDGLPQLYLGEVARPDAPPRRLTHTSERVTEALPLADGRTALFRMDHGADENWSLLRLDLGTGRSVELTPGERLQRDAPVVPDGLPTTAFFAARRMEEKASTLYRLELEEGAAPRPVYRDSESGFLVDVSRNGRSALWLRMRSASDLTLLHVDLSTGAARKLYPGAGTTAAIGDARFTRDGRRVLLATDGGGEQALVLALDAVDGRELARYVETRPATAELSALHVAKRGDTAAVLVNAGNRAELRLLDTRTLAPRARVQLPLGFGAVSGFSEDGRRLAVSWSTPGQPPDLFAVEVATGTVTPLRRDARPGLAALPAVEASITEVTAHDGLRLPVNVYLPEDVAKGAAGRKLPVVVSYHGGPSSASPVRWSPSIGFFLGQGYAWVEPNVRGSAGFGRAYEMADDGRRRPEALRDVETTARWAAAQPWADASRMVVYGGSYGGYTTLMALERNPDLWRAGVDLFGVVNTRTFLASTAGFIRDIFREEFGELGRDDAFLDSISPHTNVARIEDPLFVYAGANDPRVPRSESDQVVSLLRQRKVPVEYMVAANEGHSLARRENQVEAHARIARFLETHLRAPTSSVATPAPP